jgi:hypothetical protein
MEPFEKQKQDFNIKFDIEIQKHIEGNAFTDRKILGALLGTGLIGGLGFVIFSGAISFGLGGCKLSLLFS